MSDMLNLPPAVDWTIAACWVVMAFVNGQLIARLGHSPERWLRLVGWAGLGLWWAYRIIEHGELTVSVPTVFFVLMLAVASLISARRQLSLARAEVRCFQDPSQRCFREDRVRKAIE